MIKKFLAISTLVMVPQSLCAANPAKPTRGIAYEKISVEKGKFVHLFTVVSPNMKVRIVAAKTLKEKDQLARGLFLSDYAVSTEADILISAGYMSSYSPPTPLGYVKIDGRQISPKHNSWLMAGYFCSNGQARNVMIGRADAPPSSYKYCIQSGPLFIEDGSNRYGNNLVLVPGEEKLSGNELTHAFACINKSKQFVIGVSDEMSLNSLSNILLDNKKKSADAIRLTGSTSAGLRVAGELVGSDELPQTTVITLSHE